MVDIRVRRLRHKAVQLGVPVLHQLCEFRVRAPDAPEFLHGLAAKRARLADADKHHDFLCLAGGKLDIRLQGAAAGVAVGVAAGARAVHHGLRLLIAAVGADKGLAARIVARGGSADQRHPRHHGDVAADFDALVSVLDGKVVLDGDAEHVVLVAALRDEQRVLEVHLILLSAPLVGEFAVAEGAQAARAAAGIGELEPPVFEELSERHIVRGLGADAAVFGADFGVRGAVAAFALVLVKRFAYRLPRCRPVVAGITVAQVEVAARLIHRHRVEAQSHEAPPRPGLVETVAARVVGDDSAVLGGTEVVAP